MSEEDGPCRFGWAHDFRHLYNLGENRYFRRCLICGEEREGWTFEAREEG